MSHRFTYGNRCEHLLPYSVYTVEFFSAWLGDSLTLILSFSFPFLVPCFCLSVCLPCSSYIIPDSLFILSYFSQPLSLCFPFFFSHHYFLFHFYYTTPSLSLPLSLLPSHPLPNSLPPTLSLSPSLSHPLSPCLSFSLMHQTHTNNLIPITNKKSKTNKINKP